MRLFPLMTMALMGLSTFCAGAFDTQNVQLIGTTDRNPVEYSVNEPMTFTITADLAGQSVPEGDYFINWTRLGDDDKTESGQGKLSDGPVTFQTSIDRPGFVRILASISAPDGKKLQRTFSIWGNTQTRDITFEGGAGANVAEITQAAPEPKDFDAFWLRQKERLAAVPLNYTMDKIPGKNGMEIYAVTIDCAGPRPVTGYLFIPENTEEKSLPVRVAYQGYGTGKQWPNGGSQSEVQFHVNAHGFELGQPDDYYKQFAESIKSNGTSYAFDKKQNSNPEEAYFNGMALRLMRSLQFVKQLPQWDGKTLIASGGSQGGLQAIWAAALDSDVTRCESGITWCSNLAGNAVDKRLNGWFPGWVEPLGYYDAVNHAKRIKCQTVITRAGLGDYTCPPSGIAVLYNNLKAPKKIIWVQGSNHGYIPTKPVQFVQEHN